MSQNANRGMFLETILARTAAHLATKNLAWIDKRHLPIQPFRFAGSRVEGHLRAKTQTDYYGVYAGHYLDFEAKQTQATSFPLNNLPAHQLNHLRHVKQYGAICFLIVYFVQPETFWLLSLAELENFLKTHPERASIPYSYFQEHAQPLDLIYPGVLDLLTVLDRIVANTNE